MERPNFTVTRLTDGLRYGDGAISGQDADPEMLRFTDEAIASNPDIIVPVDTDDNGNVVDDDGCGDGREVGRLQRGQEILKRSLHRAKVFGGALAMAAADRIGLGGGAGKNMTVVFDDALQDLTSRNLNFGAHTADHVAAGREDIDCGCGAIDGAPAVIAAIEKYHEQIAGTLKVLDVGEEAAAEVLQNFVGYAAEFPAQPSYSGRAVITKILQSNKVVKQLVGPHKERRIVINMVPGYTVNQALVRELSGGKVQVFAVDYWRLEDIARGLHPHDERLQQKSLAAQLVYTLGVAAVLTPGDMPVDVISTAA